MGMVLYGLCISSGLVLRVLTDNRRMVSRLTRRRGSSGHPTWQRTRTYYPLVNVYITMENHHFLLVNQLFLWQFSIAMLVYGCFNHITPFYRWDSMKKWTRDGILSIQIGNDMARQSKSWSSDFRWLWFKVYRKPIGVGWRLEITSLTVKTDRKGFGSQSNPFPPLTKPLPNTKK